MFPSSGLFAEIVCPLSNRGLCERPHCFYKHATGVGDMFGASHKTSILDFAGRCFDDDSSATHSGVQNSCSSADRDQAKDVCLQELERINKEIETVRHEVEQEQRRLSHYQTVQVDGTNAAADLTVPMSEPAGERVDRGCYGLSSCTDLTKKYFQTRKYVVDNSKPRTDLEYDPLSNFSAGLRSCCSSRKEQKMKNGQGLKSTRNTGVGDQKKSVAYPAQLLPSPSPEPLDDLTEVGDLIIDISPSPEKKGEKDKKCPDLFGCKSLQDKVEEFKEVKTVPNLLQSSPLHLSNAEACIAKSVPATSGALEENMIYIKCAVNNKGPSSVYESTDCKGFPADVSADLERRSQKMTLFQAAETEVEKNAVPLSASAFTSQLLDKERSTFQVTLPHCELSYSVEKMNPLQPKNSLFYQPPTAKSDSQCRKRIKQDQTAEPALQNRAGNVPLLLPDSQKASIQIPGPMHIKTALNHTPPDSCLEPAEKMLGHNQGQAPQNLSASDLTNRGESSSSSSALNETHVEKAHQIITILDSSSDDELNYSEIDLSDSDPMEECYRIFMEENEEKGIAEPPETSVGAIVVEKPPELKVKPQELPGKKRVAHEAKHAEPVAKSRPQPQVLVPLRGPAVSGFASQPSITSKMQQVQQRASILGASDVQTFVSPAIQRRPDPKSASPSAQVPENQLNVPVQNGCVNYVRLGTAVINVGNNLHLILPEGAFPVAPSSGPVPSVLTPIGRVQMSPSTVTQTCHPPAVTSTQRCRTPTAVLIPALARKPLPTPAFALAPSSAASLAAPPPAVHSAVKPLPTKRKLKHQAESTKDKVPRDIRQRYVNMFTEEFLKTTPNVNDAFEKALAEERTVYNRSVNKLKYLSIAVNALKRLKNQTVAAAKDENQVNSQRFRGNVPLNLKQSKGNEGDMTLYESLKDYILTEDRLIESNYPVQHPEKLGSAVLFVDNKKGSPDSLKRICCRCGATYSVSPTGKHIRKEECNYHYGKGVTKRVPGGVETRYSCCEGVMGAPGCQVFKLHVHDSLSLDGFVSTVLRNPSDMSCPGIFSLDCEMCFTINGLELSRVTLVNSSLQVIYDTFVTPDNEVIDYNTRFSGISEEDVKGNCTSLREVQEALLSVINADTILIGHGLETDLCALKLLHGRVVDTSMVFPHRLGPPHKRPLNSLTAEHLRRIIQQSVCGHDTAEDAAACMELMLWKVKEDGKLK